MSLRFGVLLLVISNPDLVFSDVGPHVQKVALFCNKLQGPMLGKWLKSAQPDPPHASLLQQGLQSRIVSAGQLQSEKLLEVDGTVRRSNEAQGLLQKRCKTIKIQKIPENEKP